MSIKSGFSIYRRPRKNGKPVFYIQFKNPDGTYQTGKSTGCTTKREALKWAEDYLTKNGTPTPGRKITLKEYSNDFFSWESPWALNKRVEGKRVSLRHCKARGDMLRLHVLPALGEKYLTDISKEDLRTLRNELFARGFSGSQINKVLYTLKAILSTAEDAGLINAVPTVPAASNRPRREKGVLTMEEVARLFAFEWKSIPAQSHPSKPQFMGYVGNLLAASTGLRLSEIQGLQIRDIYLDGRYIVVRRAWDNDCGVLHDTTKNGRERTVLIPGRIVETLRALLLQHPCPHESEAFVLWGEKAGPLVKPVEKKTLWTSLYNALEKIGIDEAQRRERNITFHSWRHFLNSILINQKVPLLKIQSMVGHMSDRMSEAYYHTSAEDMSDIRGIQETIFSIEAPGTGDGIKH